MSFTKKEREILAQILEIIDKLTASDNGILKKTANRDKYQEILDRINEDLGALRKQSEGYKTQLAGLRADLINEMNGLNVTTPGPTMESRIITTSLSQLITERLGRDE